ncbi:MAG: hypothetical protein K6E15_05875 [Prevotella sp.]|jgi:hypothetical protein|nr:hypothetical protein [Prevotella sp.]
MKKFFVSMVFALSALVMLTGCVVSEEKLTDKVTQGIVEYEQEQGNRLEVTDLKLEKSEGKNYKGVLTGKLNGEDAVYDVTVTDAGSDFDIDWELRK